jgi:2-oxoglutarate dehydrogenase E1 component
MVVCNITTPANFFHALRRQLAWNFRKPLVVMSPKSLLRHPACISSVDELKPDTQFRPVIADEWKGGKGKKPRRVVMCSGKVYYDLREAMEKHAVKDGCGCHSR